MKTDIQPVTDGLAKVNQLNPITFKWNSFYKETLKRDNEGNMIQAGLIAQEVEKVIPEVVSK